MKDFIGNELNVGDFVCYMDIGYRTLSAGVIKKVNNKKSTIVTGLSSFNSSNEYTTQQFHEQCRTRV